MYKVLLILRYLRRKLAPLFAALAVTLCTAMVIIVISVMGGFLDMMRGAAKTLTGDVIISADVTGFPYYQDVMAKLQADPAIQSATPIIRSFGLLNVGGRVLTTQVEGIEPPTFDAVSGYGKTLYWTQQRIDQDLASYAESEGPLSKGEEQHFQALKQRYSRDLIRYGMAMAPPQDWLERFGQLPAATAPAQLADPEHSPGIVLGIEVDPYNSRDEQGTYHFLGSSLGQRVTLTVVPLTRGGTLLEPSVREFTVVNEFKSGLYEVDANRIYVPFALLQKMLRMDPAVQVDPDTGKPTGKMTAGRASEILVRGAPTATLEQVYHAADRAVAAVGLEHSDLPLLRVQTWRQRYSTLLDAVEKEKGLLTLLFAIISAVAVAMIGVIFYMIVLEKTRDIGTLRALGASRSGISSIFLGYGLAIGIVGSLLGLLLGALVVWNLNGIQDQLYHWFGFKMWDPRIYYFERIPNTLNRVEVTVIVIVAVISSVLGSLIPAILAARLRPVEALRYE